MDEREIRKTLAFFVEAPLAILDELDGDGEAEPTLGATPHTDQVVTWNTSGVLGDELEPSLAGWGLGLSHRSPEACVAADEDIEADDADDEDGADREPSLGSRETV